MNNATQLLPTTETGTAGSPSLLTSGDEVRRVTEAEYKQAAQCLAEAFAEDDVARYFTHMPDTEGWSQAQKWALHVDILEYIVYAHILKGLVLTAGADYGCVALWYVHFLARVLTPAYMLTIGRLGCHQARTWMIG